MEKFEVVFGDERHLFKVKCPQRNPRKMKNTAIRFGTTGTLDGSECHRLQLEGLFESQKSSINKRIDRRRYYCKFIYRLCHTMSY